MAELVDYTSLMQPYLNKIKTLREYNAPFYGTQDQCEALSIGNSLFDITDKEYHHYAFLLNEVDKCCSELLADMVYALIDKYKAPIINLVKDPPFLSAIAIENNQNTLYHFKKYGIPTIEDRVRINMISSKISCSKVVYVSLVKEKANTYLANADYEYKDISLKDFFIAFFGEDEYLCFENMEREFTKTAKAYLGHSVIKNLSPNALYGFKRYLESYFKSEEFASLVARSNEEAGFDSKCSDMIEQQFLSRRYYRALIGKTSFAESIITAEWMYYSVINADSVDLTIIALGYFKAIEQILFAYIKLHSGEDRKIKRIYIPELKNKPEKIYLNDSSIQKKYINTMLDSLITFFEDNKDLFMSELNETEIGFIISALDRVKLLRNGFFHKDNIEDSRKVVQVRESTYLALYYMLGSLKFRENDKIAFSIPLAPKSEVEKLREYMSYWAYKVYYIGYCGSPEFAASALKDEEASYDKYGNVDYSGCYINVILSVGVDETIIPIKSIINKTIVRERRLLDLTNPNLIVMEGEMSMCESGMLFSGPLKTVFKDGRFLLEEIAANDF